MNRNQELLSYYCHQLHSEWTQKKALAYLRILAEAEGNEPKKETENEGRKKEKGSRQHSESKGRK